MAFMVYRYAADTTRRRERRLRIRRIVNNGLQISPRRNDYRDNLLRSHHR